MREPLLLKAIGDYAKKSPARFHMPGHKGNDEFAKIFPFAQCDITELSFSGCLTSGEGIVRESEQNVAEILKAKRTHFVTDGSSASILAMLYVASRRGKKIVIPRNSHKSVYNGLKLFNLEPLFLECEFKDGIPLQNVESAKALLAKDGVSGLLLTAPDYFGQMPDMPLARKLTQEFGKILMVDGAHGGHMRFSSPETYVGNFADVWVDGVHKTLPCLTQASLLNVNDSSLLDDVEEGLSLVRTTSPSYPIMASIEYGEYFAEVEGFERMNKVFALVDEMKVRLAKQGVEFYSTEDRAKLLLDCFTSQIDADSLCAFLEERGVYCEFSTERYVVFMVSLMTEQVDLERLENAINEYVQKHGKPPCFTQNTNIFTHTSKVAMSYATATSAEYEYVSWSQVEGRISAENVGLFPPCYPVIVAGEIFEKCVVDKLKDSQNTFGIKNGQFKVVKNER